MASYKIFPISLGGDWAMVSRGLSSLSYSDDAMRGITLRNISNKCIEGIYYEKLVYSETIYHPIAGIEEVTRETFLHTTFHIFRDSNIMIISNPSKKFISLFNFISIYAGSLFQVKEFSFNIFKFCEFSKNNLRNFRIKQIQFPPFNILPHCVAKITISSLNDAIDDSTSVNIVLPKDFKKISFECEFNSRKLVGSVASSGSMVVSNHAGFDFFEAINVHEFFNR